MRKLIALIVFTLSFGFTQAQVTENFDGSSLCSGFLQCWNHQYFDMVSSAQSGSSYQNLCNDPGNLSLNTSSPIAGSGSLRLSYATKLNEGISQETYGDTLRTSAYGSDGNTISLKLRLSDFYLDPDNTNYSIAVTLKCGSFTYAHNIDTSSAGDIVDISTTISGSNGGGVIEIIYSSDFSYFQQNSFPFGPNTYVIDIDNFSTTAPLDLTNSCVVTALPVSFNDVKATLRRGGLLVTWATAKETNNDYFKVQLSQNGKDYHELGRVNSKAPNGNSAMPLLYNFSYQLSSSSVSYASMAIIGLLLLSSLLVLMFKNKITRLVLFVIISGSIVTAMACNKAETQKEISKGDKYFVRVAQVDKDGKQSYSKVFQVVDED